MTLKQAKSTAPAGNEWVPNAVTGLTAAGNSQGTALAIPSGQDCSILTTVAASAGVILPSAGVSLGEEYVVVNHGANALSVYPPVGGKVGNGATNAAYTLATGKAGYFINIGPLTWTSNP